VVSFTVFAFTVFAFTVLIVVVAVDDAIQEITEFMNFITQPVDFVSQLSDNDAEVLLISSCILFVSLAVQISLKLL
ncbi:MAG: hypothetical protein ABGZ17_00120, partial [Planctomycetaceae bacterium]